MPTYSIEFGKLGDTYPVPPLTVTADGDTALCRAVEQHAMPYLRPALTELGRPEAADCIFHTNENNTYGEFMTLNLAAGTGARFCAARITTVAAS